MSWAAKLKSCCMGGDNNGSYLLCKCCSILIWSLRPTLCCGHSSHIILLRNRLVLLRVSSVICVLVLEFASGTTFSASTCTCTCKTSLDLKIPKYKQIRANAFYSPSVWKGSIPTFSLGGWPYQPCLLRRLRRRKESPYECGIDALLSGARLRASHTWRSMQHVTPSFFLPLTIPNFGSSYVRNKVFRWRMQNAASPWLSLKPLGNDF